jgi:hypothetical protein
MATKKTKKKKLDPIPKINRRLFRLWSEAIRENAGHQCEYCHAKRGDAGENGKKINKIDSHHFYSRDVKDCPLKWDIRNGIAVCPSCHKFGNIAFHKNPLVCYEWLRNNQPEKHRFVLENHSVRVDLHNRSVLAQIEIHLKNKEPLDLDKLIKIDLDEKAKKAEKELEKGSLFEDPNEDMDLLSLEP